MEVFIAVAPLPTGSHTHRHRHRGSHRNRHRHGDTDSGSLGQSKGFSTLPLGSLGSLVSLDLRFLAHNWGEGTGRTCKREQLAAATSAQV